MKDDYWFFYFLLIAAGIGFFMGFVTHWAIF